MIEVLKSFDVKAWLLTGGLGLILTSLVTVLVMMIKQRINAKSDIMQRKILNESTMSTLVGLGTDITSILTAIKDLSETIPQIMSMLQVSNTTSTNVAMFVLECFNEANLSDEKKHKLKTLFEKTFFTDNEQLIQHLKDAKADSDNATATATKLITELQQRIQEKDAEILSARTTRKSRRI